MERLRRLGLQRKIMLLVAIGLATMFAIGGFLGSNAIDEAAELVFRERLATAYSTVALVERDFDQLAADIVLLTDASQLSDSRTLEGLAESVLEHVGVADRYPFLSVVGVSLSDRNGTSIADVGESPRAPGGVAREIALPEPGAVGIERASWSIDEGVPFVDITVPISSPAAPQVSWATARTVSTNSDRLFDPATYTMAAEPTVDVDPAGQLNDAYNLEILGADGATVLSIGQGSPVGAQSSHLAAIGPMLESRTAAALADERAIDPHVMAGVPIAGSPLYLVLEQPVDVALALPNQLRQRLLLLIGVGFLAAMTVAWFTTRRVVKPTEELTAAASRMAQGDLTQPIDVAAYDEVASLAETLELMRQRLLDAQTQLVEVNRDLESRIEERTARLGFVLRKTISAQEDERHALARELHDETAQTIAALTIALDRAREDVTQEPGHGLERIGEAKAIATRLLAEVRRLIMGLRPSVLDDLGLGPAISWYAETVMAERDNTTDVRVDAQADRMPRHLEVALYRIAQEALNNVAKHAEASSAVVRLRHDGDEVELLIEDDGSGFAVETTLARAAGTGGVGLAGMQERVALLGGSMSITSEPGSGTAVLVRAPITAGGRE